MARRHRAGRGQVGSGSGPSLPACPCQRAWRDSRYAGPGSTRPAGPERLGPLSLRIGPMGFEALLALQLGVLLAGTAVHELGHAATAMALGFRVAGVRVGPVLGVAMPAGWRLRFTWEMAAGGELLSLPPRPDGLRWRHAVMITAGPAAHLAAAAAALTAAAATGALPLWLSAATLGG